MRRALILLILLAGLLAVASPAQATSTITVNDTAVIVGNQIVVSGTYSCDPITVPFASIGVTLIGPGGASKGGSTTFTCPAVNAPWELTIPKGSIRPGNGTAIASITAPGSGDDTTSEPVVIV
jgi:hypothetical protein